MEMFNGTRFRVSVLYATGVLAAIIDNISRFTNANESYD